MMFDPDRVNRLAKGLLDTGEAKTVPEAMAILRSYRLQILVSDNIAGSRAWQGGILTAVNSGIRAMLGGVDVLLESDVPSITAWGRGPDLSDAVLDLGASVVDVLDPNVPTLVFGAPLKDAPIGRPVIYVHASGWRAGASHSSAPLEGEDPIPTAAATAAGIAVSEAFQRLRGNPVAGDRETGISLWQPSHDWRVPDPTEPALAYLPTGAWLIGLGHLGQAYAWHLGLLPYEPSERPRVWLQDTDAVTDANRGTSLLLNNEPTGTLKTRLVSSRLEGIGFRTSVIERKFLGDIRVQADDPRVALVGLDNAQGRRRLTDAGFQLVVDAGLGAGADSYTDMYIHELPGEKPSESIWENDDAAQGPDTKNVYPGLVEDPSDRCGVELLAGKTVATSFVGVVAGGLVVAAVLRHLHGGPDVWFIDHSLRSPKETTALPFVSPRRAPRVPACILRNAN